MSKAPIILIGLAVAFLAVGFIYFAGDDGEVIDGARAGAVAEDDRPDRARREVDVGDAGEVAGAATPESGAAAPPGTPEAEADAAPAPGVAVVTSPLRGVVKTRGGRPIEGAAVALTPYVEMKSFFDLDIVKIIRELFDERPAVDETETDEAGTFVFERVPVGTYLAVVEADGFQKRFSDPVTIREGAAAPLISVTLSPGVPLRGQVVDEGGVGIPNAVVAVLADPNEARSFVFRSHKTRSGPDGRFLFTSLGPEKYIVMARAEGFAPSGDVKAVAGKEPVTIALDRGVTMSGRCFDVITGEGVGGVELLVFDQGGPAISETVSQPDGSYLIERVPAVRRLQVVARHPRYTVRGDPKNPQRAGTLTLRREKGDTSPIREDIALTAGGVVAGRVVDAETGQGLAHARVRVVNLGGMERGFNPDRRNSVVADAEGAFRIDNVPPGAVMAMATVVGYLQDFKVDSQKGPTVLEPGGALESLEIRMRPGLTLTGAVVDPDGAPVAGATIVWFGVEDEMSMMRLALGATGEASVHSDAEGRFTILGIAPDSALKIMASHPDFAGGASRDVEASKQGEEPLTLTLERGGTLRGLVVRPDGTPAAGALLGLSFEERAVNPMSMMLFARSGPVRRVTADDEGRFEAGGLTPGEIGIQLLDDAEAAVADHQRSQRLRAGEIREVRIELVGLVAITGRVLDETGAGVAGAWVTAAREDAGREGSRDAPGRHAWAETRPDGGFELRGLAPGATYGIEAVVSGRAAELEGARGAATGVAARTQDLQIRLKRPETKAK